MGCYHPLIGQVVSDPTTTTGRRLKVISSVDKIRYFSAAPEREFSVNAHQVFINDDTGEYIENITIPCGKCIGCRLDYSRKWADRMVLEQMATPGDTWFVTLTYDDEHLPVNDLGFSVLKKKQLQDFFKRLRISVERRDGKPSNLRFYACGEYGTKTGRAHYHAIVYNLQLSDLQQIGRNEMGNALFNSGFLSKIWSFGFVVVAPSNWSTAAYVARYVTKKWIKSDEQYIADHQPLPFTTMSLKPGIGAPWYFQNLDLFGSENPKIVLPPVKDKEHIIAPPEYFERLFLNDGGDPQVIRKLHDRRRFIAEATVAETDLDELNYFEVKESVKKKSMERLIRSLD